MASRCNPHKLAEISELSAFFVGFVIQTRHKFERTREEVEAALAKLYTNARVQKATHNQYAWRCEVNGAKGTTSPRALRYSSSSARLWLHLAESSLRILTFAHLKED